jgi:O-antigen/teichoic acid export membrane protein
MIQALRLKLKDDPRLARVLKGGASGVAGKVISVLVNAVSLPLTVRYLGPQQYGFWVTITTTVMMLGVFDLGIANTLTNYISRAFAEDSEEMARRYYSSAFWAAAAIALVAGLVGAVVWHSISWGALFHLSDPAAARQAGYCAAISLGYFLLNLPLSLASKVLGGYQRVPIANAFAMINSVLGLIATILVIRLHGTVVHLMIAFCASMLTGTVFLNLWMVWFHEPRMRPEPRRAHFGTAREIIGHGTLFFVVQMSGLIVFNSDNLIIAHFLGADQVTPYAVTWRLVGYAAMLQSLLVPSLWPAFAEAYVGGDLAWIRAIYRRIERNTVMVVGSAALLLGFTGRWIIGIWAGKAAVPNSALLWCMCFWAVLLSITVNQAALLAATQRLQLQAVIGILSATLNLALSIVLVQHMGTIGVLLATIISYLLLVVLPQTWEVRRILSGRYLKVKIGESELAQEVPMYEI